jgi:hypothetical protein
MEDEAQEPPAQSRFTSGPRGGRLSSVSRFRKMLRALGEFSKIPGFAHPSSRRLDHAADVLPPGGKPRVGRAIVARCLERPEEERERRSGA